MKKLEYRYEIINHVIEKYGYTSFGEIGFDSGYNFNKVNCAKKWSIDPSDKLAKPPYLMTSDEYFKNHAQKAFCWFVDGLHWSEQVYKDVINCLDNLEEGGCVLMHDCRPTNEPMQRYPRETKEWCGDTWKAFVKLRSERDDLEMFVIDTDYGVGLCRPSKEKVEKLDLKGQELTYENLIKNEKSWLNLISPEEALKRL